MQTLSLFPTPLFTNKQAPTFKVSAASEGVSTFTAPSRLSHDTVSFSATPKIRSGTAVAPALSEGELPVEQKALIKSVIRPYLRMSAHDFNNSHDWKKALMSEIDLPSCYLSQHLQPQALLRPHLPEPYHNLNSFQMTIAENHQALVPLNTALKVAQMNMSILPSEALLSALEDTERERLFTLTLQNPDLIRHDRSLIFEILSQFPEGSQLDQEFLKYRSQFFDYVEGVEQAENALKLERVIQQRLLDLDVFKKTAKKLGLEKQYIHAFRQSFTSESGGKLPFNSRYSKLREQYEALLRVIIPHSENKSKYFRYNFNSLEHIEYKALETVFSQDRQEKVKQVLGLLEKSPETVVTFIKELRRVTP